MNEIICFESTMKTLPTVTNLGNVYIRGCNRHFRRRPDEYILYFITEGSMIIVEGDRKYTLQPGDTIIFDPSELHYGIEQNTDVKYRYVHFKWKDFSRFVIEDNQYNERLISNRVNSIRMGDSFFCEPIYILAKYCTIHGEDMDSIELLFMEMEALYGNAKEFTQAVLGAKLIELLAALEQYCSGYLMSTNGKIHQISIDITAYLKTHYKEKISSRDIEENFHSNFNYLNRRFKENTGNTIFVFLNEYRISESMNLLKNSQLSISEIAELIGFCNEFYFSRVFKKFRGISPSDYRKKYQ